MYRAYRPQTFDEVVGQQNIIKTLKNAIAEDKISHAYLFCGPRGTGKTSLARLFAKALNCQEGIGHQCNHCASCTAITNGEHPDVVEIDAASNSGVDNVRALIQQINYQPIMGRYKIYIIDEVHNMSNDAFNSLLKTLEEPPEYVVFILATTEPQKIIPTILSRVQRFDFSKISNADLIRNMKNILKKENTDYEDEALEIIAKLADGGVRDSLSLLDQVLSYCHNKITTADVYSLFGLLTLKDKMDYVKLIKARNLKDLLAKFNSDYSKGLDIAKLHSDLIKIYKDYLVYALTKDDSVLSVIKPETYKECKLSLKEINFNLQTLVKSYMEYNRVTSLYNHFELTLINLISALQLKDEDANPEPRKIEKHEVMHTPLLDEEDPDYSYEEPAPVEQKPVKQEKKIEKVKKSDPVKVEKKEEPKQEVLKDNFDDVPLDGSALDEMSLLAIMKNNNKSNTSAMSTTLYNNFLGCLTNFQFDQTVVNTVETCSVRSYSFERIILVTSNAHQAVYCNRHPDKLNEAIQTYTGVKNISAIVLSDATFNYLKEKYIELMKANKLSTLQEYEEKLKASTKSNSDLFVEDLFRED